MNTDYTFRRLSSDEVLDIYENSCPLHFPAPEIKPVFMIKSMVERGGYIGIGVYWQGMLSACRHRRKTPYCLTIWRCLKNTATRAWERLC